MKSKSPASSATTKTEIVCANDTNPMGFLLGGKLVQWMDIAAAVCAQTHAENICVTASINAVDFLNSARVGDIIQITAKITRSYNTSMEIYTEAFARSVQRNKVHPISSAFFTFVALDDHGNLTSVPAVKPKTAAEKQLYNTALLRRKQKVK